MAKVTSFLEEELVNEPVIDSQKYLHADNRYRLCTLQVQVVP